MAKIGNKIRAMRPIAYTLAPIGLMARSESLSRAIEPQRSHGYALARVKLNLLKHLSYYPRGKLERCYTPLTKFWSRCL